MSLNHYKRELAELYRVEVLNLKRFTKFKPLDWFDAVVDVTTEGFRAIPYTMSHAFWIWLAYITIRSVI